MYSDYALHEHMQSGLRTLFGGAAANARMASSVMKFWGVSDAHREFEAAATMLSRSFRHYPKPNFNLPTTNIDGTAVQVREQTVLTKPYGDLVHFQRDTDRSDPKLLIVAPMSGHHATLLRGTVEAMLPHHEVYITDWANARDVPRSQGDFGLDDYVDYVRSYLTALGPNTHVLAVCQPTVPVLAASALMAAADDPNQPLSLTVMGGPIDTRAAPTKVTEVAHKHSLSWFKQMALSEVPGCYAGAGQIVYPSYKQIANFVMMNPDRHVRSHWDLYDHLRRGNAESASKLIGFYDEYLVGPDMSGRYFIDTVDQVFKRQTLAKGEMSIHNQRVDLSAMRHMALLTVEGERDDISAPGQTVAAHNLCNNIAQERHFAHLQPKVGHYGIFEGRAWREEISPRVAAFIRKTGVDNGLKYSEIPVNTRLIPPNLWRSGEAVNHPVPTH